MLKVGGYAEINVAHAFFISFSQLGGMHYKRRPSIFALFCIFLTSFWW
jgi:hypothetical protein